jgi:S-adenosylmethionine:tRNA ribosyltransferase-isomerase
MKNEYRYDLPGRLIAQYPANPRDTSRLLIYDTKNNKIIIDVFKNVATHLPPSTTLTLNDAKVVPARVPLFKETGGKIVVLFLVNEWISTRSGAIPCFLDRRGRVGEKLYFADKSFVTIQRQEKELFYVTWEGKAEDLLAKLDSFGTMPIPPYIKHSPLSRDELLEKYQTIFARSPGTSAAPTASLHFTPEVFKSIKEKEINMQYITLHVGLGTFAPLTEENIRTKTLHHEWYEVPPHFTEVTQGKDITAVGTTVVRTLESVASGKPLIGETNLFISPPFEFKVVNHLITNFHLPGSSLMMLVDAFLASKGAQKRILELYKYAIENEFRFYSFRDAMLIL